MTLTSVGCSGKLSLGLSNSPELELAADFRLLKIIFYLNDSVKMYIIPHSSRVTNVTVTD